MEQKCKYLTPGSLNYQGIMEELVEFINNEQLLNRDLWAIFVDQFVIKDDSTDEFWRGEFWGKMMRGACLCYQYENNEKLYEVLEETVENMLKAQDELGRFSTYTVETEFRGWDMWGRKYIMTSMIHFYRICKNEDLKQRIIAALSRHADYIIEHVGEEEGKISICETSQWWLGINSCSICETFVGLYSISKEQRFLDFAKYIIDIGGIREGNLLEDVKKGKMPYEFPETKAYETMSFFEGVLDYGQITDNQELIDVAIKFYEDLYNTELSITGNAGAEDELFNNGKVTQVLPPKKFMQETCVTVTWMRALTKLYLLTGEQKYMDRFVTSCYNAYYGSLNFEHQNGICSYNNSIIIKPLPFDSYSPLKNDRRGKGTGGLLFFRDGTTYGCCACIGSAGIGLWAINSILNCESGVTVNDYLVGEAKTENMSIKVSDGFVETGKVTLTVKGEGTINLRIPTWANEPTVTINGEITKATAGTYHPLTVKGDVEIIVDFHPVVRTESVNGHTAFLFGEIVLAISEEDNELISLQDLRFEDITDVQQVETKEKCLLTFTAKHMGKTIYLRDYASAGKKWFEPHGRLSVWIENKQ
jgi:DUF1680 family protein